MPIVHIHLLKRDKETKKKIAESVTKALSESGNTPIENVKIVFSDMEPYDYAIGGRLLEEIRAEENK